MVERFFSINQPTLHHHEFDDFTLLSGPPSSGKTSLLFQLALNLVASSPASHVIFICSRRRIETKPPYLSQGVDPSCNLFERIQMKYVEDDEGIKKYFCGFHLQHKLPAAVIVDDFGDFFQERSCQDKYGNSRGRDMAMVRTLALCRNAISHSHADKKGVGGCKVVISDTHQGETPRLLFIYNRWIPTIFTSKADGHGSYVLTSNHASNRKAKYSIAFQYLMLDKIM